MIKISIEQIRSANKKIIAGKASEVKKYSAKFSKDDINIMLKQAYDSLSK